MHAIRLLDVAVHRENNPVAGQLVEETSVGELQCVPAEGAEWERGRYGKALKVVLERSAEGLPRGPWVLKAAVPEDPADAEAARECLRWEKEALAGQNRAPLFPTLAATGVLADEAETPFLLMSPVEGRTLRDVLDEDIASLAPEPPDGGPLSGEAREALRRMEGERRLPVVTAVREIALPLAEGLAGLEERGFCHGDVSPSNVVVGGDGTVRMVDLGCLGSLGEEPRGKGTEPYVLPGWDECPDGHPRDCRGVDAYALAVLLRELTGPTDDLIPPAAECAGALDKAGMNSPSERRWHAGCFPLRKEDETTVSKAYYVVAMAMEKRFSTALDEYLSRFDAGVVDKGDFDACIQDEPFHDMSGLCRVFERYSICWNGGIWTLLEMLADVFPLATLFESPSADGYISEMLNGAKQSMTLEELLDETLAFSKGEVSPISSGIPYKASTLACSNTLSYAFLECARTGRLGWEFGDSWEFNGAAPDESSMLLEQAVAMSYESNNLDRALDFARMAGRCAKRERNGTTQVSVAIKQAELQYLQYCLSGSGDILLRRAAGLALNALRLSMDRPGWKRAAVQAACVLSSYYEARVDDDTCRLLIEKALDSSSVAGEKNLEVLFHCLLFALENGESSCAEEHLVKAIDLECFSAYNKAADVVASVNKDLAKEMRIRASVRGDWVSAAMLEAEGDQALNAGALLQQAIDSLRTTENPS